MTCHEQPTVKAFEMHTGSERVYSTTRLSTTWSYAGPTKIVYHPRLAWSLVSKSSEREHNKCSALCHVAANIAQQLPSLTDSTAIIIQKNLDPSPNSPTKSGKNEGHSRSLCHSWPCRTYTYIRSTTPYAAILTHTQTAFCSKDNCCFKDNVARDKHVRSPNTTVSTFDSYTDPMTRTVMHFIVTMPSEKIVMQIAALLFQRSQREE